MSRSHSNHIVFHIGMEKTGTTSVQSFLAQNREKLAAHGIHYPISAGRSNHLALLCYAMDDDKVDDVRKRFGATNPEAIAGFRHRFYRELHEELAGCQNSTILFSNEHCSHRLDRPTELARIKDLFATISLETQILVYIRRQDENFCASYSTGVKNGTTMLPDVEAAAPNKYDYFSRIDRWAKAFGEENVRVRIYSNDDLKNGDIVQDFQSAVEIGAIGDLQHPTAKNQSLSLPALEFLRRLNVELGGPFTGSSWNIDRGDIVALLEDYPATSHLGLLSKLESERLMERFAESNERTRATYFPQRNSLFPKSTISFEKGILADSLDEGEMISIFAHLWKRKHAQVRKLRRDSMVRNAKRMRKDGQSAEAIHLLQDALRLVPGSGIVHRELSAAYSAKGDSKAAVEHAARAVEIEPQKKAFISHLERMKAKHENQE